MTEMLFSWVTDGLTSSDVIDLYFVLSDLVEIPISEPEYCESVYFDSLATRAVEEINTNKYENISLGKLVL